MSVRPAWRILAASLLLCAILVGLVVRENHARATGREVAVAMQAVDPRNLLTGHYVALDLVQPLAPEAACPTTERPASDGGWVGLRARDGRFLAAGDSREAVLRAGADVAVRGWADCRDGGEGRRSVALRIGADRFHAAQADAEAIERRLRGRGGDGEARDFAVISAGTDGRARLKGVVVDGRRTDLGWW